MYTNKSTTNLASARVRYAVQQGLVVTCGKIAYPSRQAAYRGLKRLLKRPRADRIRDGALECYECRRCGAWHVGHGRYRSPSHELPSGGVIVSLSP